ncbi:MAG TPA: hypothetical protein PLY93_10005 [Turneriella sp.]|nr:hypothetical protein [Turneriella sp.]
MRRPLALLIALTAVITYCKKNPHISQKEIEKLTTLKVDKILIQKKYQLDESASLEDVTFFQAAQKTYAIVVTPTEKSYTLIRQVDFGILLQDIKLHFISIGNKKSQALVTHGLAEKRIVLFDAQNFMQEFTPQSVDTKAVKIIKVEEKPFDELLVFGDKNFRFNGIRWIPFDPDEIFPYLENFTAAGDDSFLEITNRGQFGTRVIVSIAFTDVTGDISQKLKLTKDIPTVRLYKPGYPAHKKGGGVVALRHPLIEIQKDSWGKNGRIKLPLFMKDIQHFTLRAVYSQRGHSLDWPSTVSEGIVKDGQGYLAVER